MPKKGKFDLISIRQTEEEEEEEENAPQNSWSSRHRKFTVIKVYDRVCVSFLLHSEIAVISS